MDHTSHDNPKLTAVIDTELRALPLLRAPTTLRANVLAELARRQALPWWQQSFRDWPLVAQAGFAALALGVMHLALWAVAGPVLQGLVDSLRVLMLGTLQWVQTLASGAAILGSVTRDLFATLPSSWTLAVGVALLSSVALLFSGGTLAWRTLVTRS